MTSAGCGTVLDSAGGGTPDQLDRSMHLMAHDVIDQTAMPAPSPAHAQRRRRLAAVAGLGLALALVGSACSKSDETSTTATTAQSSGTTGTAAGSKAASTASSDELKKWQEALNAVGCGAGPVDGIEGGETEAAIKDFQSQSGLTVDGLLGPQTEAALLADVKAGKKVCSGGSTGTTAKPGTTSTTKAGGSSTTSSTSSGPSIGGSEAALSQAASRYYTSLGWGTCTPPVTPGPVSNVNSAVSQFVANTSGAGTSTSPWDANPLPWTATFNGTAWIVTFNIPNACPMSAMGSGT